MNLSRKLPLVLVLIAASFGAMAQSSTKTPAKPAEKDAADLALEMTDKQLKGFFTTLTTIIRGETNKENPDIMIALTSQGIMVDPEMKNKDVGDQKYVSKLLDQANPVSNHFSLNPKKLSAIYGDIINFAVPIYKAGTKPKITKEIQADFDLTDATVEDGPMQKYYAALAKKEDAEDAKDSEMVRNLLESGSLYAGKKFTTAVINATNELNSPRIGNAGLIEPALERIRQYNNSDPGIAWAQRVKEYAAGKFQDTFLVDTYPRLESWGKTEGWTKFHFKSTDFKDSDKFSHMDSDSTATFKNDFVDATAKAKWEKTETQKMTDDKSLVIDFEMKRVFVTWPWMDADVFSDPNWKWNANNQGKVISDGKGKGTLPYLMQSFIIVKGVKFSSNDIKKFKKTFEEKLNTSADITVGPFSVKSEFNKHDKDDFIHDTTSESSIEIPDPQIIALVSMKVPKCPASAGK